MRALVVAVILFAAACGGTTVPDPVDFPDAAPRTDATPAADATADDATTGPDADEAAADAAPAADAEAPDAEAPDAEAPDATADDATTAPDAEAPDALAAPDAAVFTLDLTASTTTATTSAPILLTAIPFGLTATAVAFYDDGARIGTVTAAPFTIEIRYTAADNGVHAISAVAWGAAGERATSDVVQIRVAHERGLYVDPSSGLDTNPGTELRPLRTITRATRLAVAGESIFLLDGVYGAGEPNPGNCIAIPPGVSLRAVRPGRVRVVDPQTGPACAFQFSGSALVDGIDLEGHDVGILFLAGTSTVQRVRVNGSSPAFDLRGTARVTMIDPVVTGYRASAFGVGAAAAEGDSVLTIRGGVFENAAAQVGMFLSRGSAHVILDGVTIRNNTGSAVRIYDNARLTLRDVLIEDCGGPGPGADQAVINMGGQNTASVRTIGLRLERTRIVRARGHGIGVIYYGNLPSQIDVDVIDSEVTDSARTGIFVNPVGQADPALALDIRVDGSTLARNAGGGISGGLAQLTIEDSTFEGSSVESGSTVRPASLRARGTTFVESEVRVNAAAPRTCDLGTAAAPGDNVFAPSGLGMTTALRLAGAVACTAVGNTWLPMVQGADASGRYPAAGSSVVGPLTGANYTLVAGATLDR